MRLPEFLETFLTVSELRGTLYVLGLPTSGSKDVLISRILAANQKSPIAALARSSNDALRTALRHSDLPATGRKSELVVRIVENDVVEFTQAEILAHLESQGKADFDAYHELVLCLEVPLDVDRVVRLLGKASETHLRVFARVLRSTPDSARVARALVLALSRGSADVPCFAAYLLENLIETAGSVAVVLAEIEGSSDEIMARQRRIQESFARHPGLTHPAVDSLLKKSWSGEVARRSGLMKDVRAEVRSATQTIETALQSLRGPAEGGTLDEMSRRTLRIDSKAEAIQREVRTLQDQVKAVHSAVQKHVEESPDQVAAALERLSKANEVKWRTRRKIRRDLERFWTLTDRLQKVEFLGRAITSYGPALVSALRGLL